MLTLDNAVQHFFHCEMSDFIVERSCVPELHQLDSEIVLQNLNAKYVQLYCPKDFDVSSLANIKINEQHRRCNNEKKGGGTKIFLYCNKAPRALRLNNAQNHNIFILSETINVSLDLHRSCNIIFGQYTTVMGMRISGGNASLAIKKGSLISDNVLCQLGDQHKIFSTLDGSICNGFDNFRHYEIGIHSWLGRGVTVIKPQITDNVILGAGCVLAKICRPFSIYAGNPAKLISEDKSFLGGNIPYELEKSIIMELYKKYSYNGKVAVS